MLVYNRINSLLQVRSIKKDQLIKIISHLVYDQVLFYSLLHYSLMTRAKVLKANYLSSIYMCGRFGRLYSVAICPFKPELSILPELNFPDPDHSQCI